MSSRLRWGLLHLLFVHSISAKALLNRKGHSSEAHLTMGVGAIAHETGTTKKYRRGCNTLWSVRYSDLCVKEDKYVCSIVSICDVNRHLALSVSRTEGEGDRKQHRVRHCTSRMYNVARAAAVYHVPERQAFGNSDNQEDSMR